ncbi:hypothetical protein EDC14_10362 [Hydrogenispora ethanolica]|jgi:hypothetical protein|uniref:Uncharacterized protein n=1 Tax=Hydrogenispora ethanolica TaxID=1082276 RepID=A0A4R1R4C3_HYDET|nr:hypothetical protein [Hydrogenispora ethanolica]TCL60250.1 hypothetical protein EDC14_10362 [Hydrogenispora ethanolica]
MVLIGQDDILLALKRFKGIAKQDLLASETIPQAEFRRTHAAARREIYAQLINMIEQSGLEKACVFAFNEYQNLLDTQDEIDPMKKGHLQALEIFFQIIGVKKEQLKKFKMEQIHPDQVIDTLIGASSLTYTQTQ